MKIELKNKGQQSNIRGALLMAAVFFVASGIGFIFQRTESSETNITMIYLLAVLITVWLTNRFIFGLLSSILATFAFNYFFAEPLFAFSVYDTKYIVTFITMTFTALVSSTLTTHAKRSAWEAQEKEAEMKAIYNLTNHLTDAKDIFDIASITVSAISDCFSCDAACLCFDENNMPEQSFIQQIGDETQIRREAGDIEDIKYRVETLRTGFYEGEEFHDWPIYGREAILGIVRLPKEKARVMTDPQMRLLRSMIESTALAMDRFRSVDQRMKSREEAMKERYRANLLRAISHDIRTPLSGILGTAEMLMDMTELDDPRHDLARGIQKNADWLHSMVGNILNLTRLQDGKLALNKQLEAVEEVIEGAVKRIAERAPEYEIMVQVPEELLLVPMDAKLIAQVVLNLLENAIRHTKPEEEIAILVEPVKPTNMAAFTVRDRGTGIREADLPYIFQSFYTTDIQPADAGPSGPSGREGFYLRTGPVTGTPDVHSKNSAIAAGVGPGRGVGLGLAICEAIVSAHGGSIEGHNRTDGPGAEFVFTLPMEDADES